MNRSVFCKRCSDASQGVVAGREAIFRGAAVALAVVLLASNPTVGQAQTIINSGFEDSAFVTFPGYLNQPGNTLGEWATSDNARAGVQREGSSSAFANNGARPEGDAVGFLQTNAGGSSVSFSNNIGGLTAGREYEISYRVNARLGNNPSTVLNVNGTDLVGADVLPVGASNPYRTISRSFVATGTSAPITIRAEINGGDDETLLLDDVRVVEKISPWSINAWNGDATSGIDIAANTYTHAVNLGSGGLASDTTINGQLFNGVSEGSPAVPASFSPTGPGAAFGGGGDANSVSSDLSNSFVFSGADSLLTLEGLTPGVEYTTSLFSVGFDVDSFRSSTFSSGDDLFTADVNEFGDNNGLRLDYTFTADGTTRVIAYSALEGSSTFHLYGFANATAVAIPEPSSLALLGVTCCGAILRRRRSVS